MLPFSQDQRGSAGAVIGGRSGRSAVVDFSVPRREGHGRGAGFVPATGTQVRSRRRVGVAEEGEREGGRV